MPSRIALLSGPLLANLCALVLRHLDGEVRTVETRQDLRSLIGRWKPELVLADLDLHPDAPEWSRDGVEIPCIGLTRRRNTPVKIAAYDRGVADIIEVPFTPDEIVVRSRASLARAQGRKPEDLRPRVRVGEFEMDLMASAVRVDGEALKLSPLEQTLLYLFLSNPGAVLTRESILTNIWGTDSALTSNVIDRHIRDLRVKLRDKWRQPRFIETVPGTGYRYIGTGTVEAAPAGG